MPTKLGNFLKRATRTSYVKSGVKKEVRKMGLSSTRKVSDRRAKQVLGELKKSGAIKTYRTPGQILREEKRVVRVEKEKLEKAKAGKMTVVKLRESRKKEEEKKEQMKKMMAGIRSRERSIEEEKEKSNRGAKTSAFKKDNLAPKRGEARVSALGGPSEKSSRVGEEKKPSEPIELQI